MENKLKISHTVYPDRTDFNLNKWFNYIKNKNMERYDNDLSYMERKILNELHDERFADFENVNKEKDKLIKKIKILDLINAATMKININKQYISSHGNLYPELANKAKHEIDILERAKGRLIQRYYRV